MTARRDSDRLVRTYLEDGPAELPDRSYDAVRAHIDHTRQRAVFGPWREPQMSKFAPYAIAAAAVLVLAAVVSINFLPRDGGLVGPGGVPTVTPGQTSAPSQASTPAATVSPEPTSAPSASPGATRLPPFGQLAAGTYYISDPSIIGKGRLSFTVPDGWTTSDAFLRKDAFLGKDDEEPGEVMLTPWIVTHVFTDACQWDDESIVDAGTSVDDLVAALVEQEGREASVPTDTTVGGFPATRVNLTVPPDLDTSTCTSGKLRYWPGAAPGPGTGPDFDSGLWDNPPGNTDAVYVVDVDGNRLVIVARHYPGSSAENRAELEAIVDSILIELP